MRLDGFRLCACLVLCACCYGCSVKEDRGSCPCRLVLDFSGVDTVLIKSAELVLKTVDGSFMLREDIDVEDFAGSFDVAVPRDEIVVTVWSGTDGKLSDEGLLIPLGEDSPPVFFHASLVDADCESCLDTVRMRKNHCVMEIIFTGDGMAQGSFAVAGNVCGYASDGRIVVGDFRAGVGEGTVILPRQTDDSLSLEVTDASGVIKSFNLGGYISESGYDWTKPDLEDLTIAIDISVTEVRLEIGGWEKVLQFDVNI